MLLGQLALEAAKVLQSSLRTQREESKELHRRAREDQVTFGAAAKPAMCDQRIVSQVIYHE